MRMKTFDTNKSVDIRPCKNFSKNSCSTGPRTRTTSNGNNYTELESNITEGYIKGCPTIYQNSCTCFSAYNTPIIICSNRKTFSYYKNL